MTQIPIRFFVHEDVKTWNQLKDNDKPYKMQDVHDASAQNKFKVISTFAGGGGSSTGYYLKYFASTSSWKNEPRTHTGKLSRHTNLDW